MLSEKQQAMVNLWEDHVRYEFEDHDVDSTLTTMTDYPHIINIPTIAGGKGVDGVREFYKHSFLHNMPDDMTSILISRTVGDHQIVDETILKFTHTVEMPWILPGIEPTHKKVEVPLVAIVAFKYGSINHEHIYWDQGTVLVQLGLIDSESLPVEGSDSSQHLEYTSQ